MGNLPFRQLASLRTGIHCSLRFVLFSKIFPNFVDDDAIYLSSGSDDSNRVTGSRCGSTGGPASTELKCSRAPRRWWTSPAARCAWAAVGIPDRRNSSVRGIDAKTLTFIPSISK
ncbi:unnamed protein product, partial [Nesidiocoris tenuis]